MGLFELSIHIKKAGIMFRLNAFRKTNMADKAKPQPLHLVEENDQPTPVSRSNSNQYRAS